MENDKKKIGIYSIFTGHYSVFLRRFLLDLDKKFLHDCQKHFFLATDKKYRIPRRVRGNVTCRIIDDLPFPEITLKRFDLFLRNFENDFENYDYVFFLNSNTRCCDLISLNDIDINRDYTFTLHDCHVSDHILDKPFEFNTKSKCCYSPLWENAKYIGGRFYGAKPPKFIEMAKVLKDNINTDIENGIIARWHDESHLNWFYNTNKSNMSYNLLPIEYHVQEQHKNRSCYNGCKLWYLNKNKKRYKWMFAHNENKKKEIIQEGTNQIGCITFLIPPLNQDNPVSGGFRTVFRMINYLMVQKKYNINIEICGEYKTSIDEQKKRIGLYKEIIDLTSVQVYFEKQMTNANLYIATGWQTFKKLNLYSKLKNRLVAFFCQDLEYEFEIVKADKQREAYTRNFYEQKIPTFTMSKFLATKFTDDRKIKSTSLNVNLELYNTKDKQHKKGICLFYDKWRPNRLPKFIAELALGIAKKHPSKNIYLYGDDTMKDLDVKSDNIKLLGTLTAEETAELYKKCELGVIFSTTNPSRIAYEMVACGTPVIEADCEYTKYDMDSDAFVRLKTDFDVIMNKLEELFGDSNEMDRLRDECEIYSKNNFKKNAEEQRFLEFVENDVMENA